MLSRSIPILVQHAFLPPSLWLITHLIPGFSRNLSSSGLQRSVFPFGYHAMFFGLLRDVLGSSRNVFGGGGGQSFLLVYHTVFLLLAHRTVCCVSLYSLPPLAIYAICCGSLPSLI